MSYPYYPAAVCASCSYSSIYEPGAPIGCRTCNSSSSQYSVSSVANVPIQKIIEKTVRVDAGLYTENVGPLHVYTPPVQRFAYVNWNQMSDRAVPGVVHRNVPSHGNSTRTSITRHRPGSMSAASSSSVQGSKGVDMKHGSYDRYLARLKGKGPLRTQTSASTAGLQPVEGNKTTKYGIANSNQCFYPITC